MVVRRLSIAGMLAVLLIALGVTLRFDDAEDELDLALFFELCGEMPGKFLIDGREHSAPLLLPVGGADPGRIEGTFPGSVVPLELTPVRGESFFRSDLLLAELRPGSEVVAQWSDTHMRFPIGGGELFRVGFLVLARDSTGERPVLLIGVGADDPREIFPAWIRGTHAAAIPIAMPPDSARLSSRIASRSPVLEGTPDAPRRYLERIEIRFGPGE